MEKRTLLLVASTLLVVGLLAAPPAQAQRDQFPSLDQGAASFQLHSPSAAFKPGAGREATNSLSWSGPSFPPPGGVTFTQSGSTGDGSIGRAAGKQWFFSGIGLASATSVYWGPVSSGVTMSFDGGSYSGAEVMGLSFLDGPNGVAIWSGQTHFSNSTLVYTRFRLEATNGITGGSTPQPIESDGISGIGNADGVVLPVGPGLSYTITMHFEASFDNSTWFPALNFYDSFNSGSAGAFSSITAGFWYAPFTVTPSVSGAGSISPNVPSDVLYGGSSPVYTFTPDPCNHLADVVLDGSTSLGPVASYQFTGVVASHTIQAVFAPDIEVITASAGVGGTISPSGAVNVNCGSNQNFLISPSGGYVIANVIVDSASQGPLTSYLFTGVTGNHTISATFALLSASTTVTPVASTCITPTNPCVDVPVNIARSSTQGMRAFSVDVLLSSNLTLCAPTDEGSYLNSIGATQFQVLSNGGGSYTVDCSILGLPCGATAATGTLFTLHVASSMLSGTGTVTVTAVTLRDCSNAGISGSPGPAASVDIDNTVPLPITALAAAQQTSGNDADGTTIVNVSWPAVGAGESVEIYRQGFGFYPEYDDAGGSAPSAPSYPPPGTWILAGTVTGPTTLADETTVRDFYYYVAFVKDACGNVSGVSNETGGTLNYHLGDVEPLVGVVRGDNQVSTSDVSNLGFNYGITLAFNDPLNYLDVGPTTDFSVNGRPTTDNRVQFEDLLMFAINYGQVSAPAFAGRPAVPSGADALALDVPELPAVGQTFAVGVQLSSAGTVKGLSVQLGYDPAVVEPAGVEAGELLSTQHVPSLVLSSGPGDVDAVVLGNGVTITGSGEVARAQFRVKAKGDAAIRMVTMQARDKDNRALSLGVLSAPGGATLPAGTALGRATPNPFSSETTLELALRHEGEVSLDVYDLSGRHVSSVLRGVQPAGVRLVKWDGRGEGGMRMAPGVYLLRLDADGMKFSRRVLLVP
jgi:cohesin domain-containing protein/flagellar hook capping protein FlgD